MINLFGFGFAGFRRANPAIIGFRRGPIPSDDPRDTQASD
jgi:hypothetical protein